MSSQAEAIVILSSSDNSQEEVIQEEFVQPPVDLFATGVARPTAPPRPTPPATTPHFISFDRSDQLLTFGIEGNPSPLARNRFFNRGLFGPSKTKLKSFKSTLEKAMLANQIDLIPFPGSLVLSVTVWFYMKRPNEHFVGRRRDPGNIRTQCMEHHSWCRSSRGPDIDNLAKFVLDAMSNAVYKDDGQVVKLVAYMPNDNHALCHGRTIIQVQPMLGVPNPPPVPLAFHFPVSHHGGR